MPKFRDEAQKAETGIRIIPRCEIIANAGQYARDKRKGLSLITDALRAKAGGIIFSLWGDPKQVTPDDWLIEFKEFSDRSGIDFIGEPWTKDDITQFERLKVKRYKVGYEDIVDLDLLDAIRITGKPVLLSIGVTTYSEIENALKTLRP
ncbi:MAG TPA: N-acetylneuraminate synthase family protein, partial [Candidatus Hodarchaeales archaeon]|nr:N-acetylneuraminate synthase family protein [Candidatus Hodarchaeales archaeon]